MIGFLGVAPLVGGSPDDSEPAAEPLASEQEGASRGADIVEPVAGHASDVTGATAPAVNQALVEERVRVVGSTDRARESTGSVQFIGEEALARQGHTDVQRILRNVPGVNLQDEEGYGLRPNIGLRGTGVERSQKITLMEDGVLVAPAPYSAPSAYYFPTAGRMESMEISKGPSSIRQGPYTTGGVLNLISHAIPNDFEGHAELAVGDDEHVRAKLAAGDSTERFGWLVETFQQQTDGFKRLDGGGDTGFDLEDYVAKLRVNSSEGTRVYQSLELKVSATDQLGDETYLGLIDEDFDRDPYRRYVASSEDFIIADHEQIQLRHFVVPSSSLDLTTTAYYNDFFRNWHKLQSVVNEVEIDGELQRVAFNVSSVLGNPDAPLFDGLMEVIRGEKDSAPGDLRVRNNRRDYYSRGIQSVMGLRPEGGRHQIEIGVRYHEDEEDRFQEEDQYQMLDGSMQFTALGSPGSQANRINRAEAFALFVRDTIQAGRLRIEPGVRFESIDFTQTDFGKNDPGRTGVAVVTKTNDVSELIPGVGLTYDVSPRVGLFGGVHKGFAPPGPGKNEQVDPEESVNYELGVRLGGEALNFQAVAFFNDYENLIGIDTASSGGEGTGDQFNGGEVQVRGLEVSFDGDLLRNVEGRYSLPIQLAYTYTHGEFRNSFATSFADWAPSVESGDELPYLPEHQLSVELGWRAPRWSVSLGGSFVDEMRTKAGQGAIPESESIEDHLVFDATGEYRFGRRYRAFLQVRNLNDEVYVAARRPAGLRPGLPRTTLAGFGVTF